MPYSFKDVAFGKKVAESADRPTLMFFRHAPFLQVCRSSRCTQSLQEAWNCWMVAPSALLTSTALGRGKCYSAKAGNIGMVLRRSVVQGLSSLQQPDVNLCCQGLDAPPKVSLLMNTLDPIAERALVLQGTDAPLKVP